MHLNRLLNDQQREHDFANRHGKPITIQNGTCRLFETGACIVFQEFTGDFTFHEPSDDPPTRMRLQRDYYRNSIPSMETEFRTLKSYPPSAEIRDRLLELQNLVVCYRQKIEEIEAELKQTPQAQRAAEQASQVQDVERAMAQQQRRLQTEIDAIEI